MVERSTNHHGPAMSTSTPSDWARRTTASRSLRITTTAASNAPGRNPRLIVRLSSMAARPAPNPQVTRVVQRSEDTRAHMATATETAAPRPNQ